METGNHHLLDLELDSKLALYQEDVLLLKVQAAGLKSQLLRLTCPSLAKDLRHMVNNPECSDVIFICEDGERVHASRMLLVARSDVLRSLLTNGMAESQLPEVLLPEISSDVLLLVLNFLYTGELWEVDLKFSVVSDQDAEAHHDGVTKDHGIRFSPFSLDWLFMFRVIKSAQFLLLNDLECVMVTRLWADLPRHVLYSEEILNQVTERFTIVCNFLLEVNEGASGRHIYILGLHLLKIMSEHDLSVTHLRNLSYESMLSYLYHTKNHSKDQSWNLSFREYIRLWQLITWCIISVTEINDSCEDPSSLFLPEPKRAASFLMEFEAQQQFFLQLSRDVSSEIRQEFAARIQRSREQFDVLKGMINLAQIYPELLIHVIEPLGMFSSTEIGSVVRDQLLRASMWRKQVQSRHSRCNWQVVDAGKIRLITDERLGSEKLAVAKVAMWCHSVYQWEIVHSIEVPQQKSMVRPSCPSFTVDVGFLSLEGRETMEDSCLSENKRAWAFRFRKEQNVESIKCVFYENGENLSASTEGFASTETKGVAELEYIVIGTPSRVADDRNLKWAVHIRMKLDRLKNSCSVSCKPDGKEYSVVCKNLSRGILFPAVYVVYDTFNCECQTQIKLLEGLDLSF